MRESGYYPAGAENDPRAPYNEPLNREYSVSLTLSFTIDSENRQEAVDNANDIAESVERFLGLNDVDNIVIDDVAVL
jgi:hypothetical protein